MTTEAREQAIQAARLALVYALPNGVDPSAAVVDAVEPIFRADADRRVDRMILRDTRRVEQVEAEVRARLRAQVEALPETQPMDPWDWHEVVEVVLALLDGASTHGREVVPGP